jgi:hypothetical protein
MITTLIIIFGAIFGFLFRIAVMKIRYGDDSSKW